MQRRVALHRQNFELVPHLLWEVDGDGTRSSPTLRYRRFCFRCDRPTGEWAKSLTNGESVDVVISALGHGAPITTVVETLHALRRGGKAVNVGGVAGILPVDMHWLMDEQIQLIGSNWFSAAQGQEMAELARAGTLNLSVFEHHRFPLANVNDAISDLKNRNGGFSNYVVMP